MLMYKINICQRAWGRWRDRKHRGFAPSWRHKLTKLPFWVLQTPDGRGTQHPQATTDEDEPVGREKEFVTLPTVAAHPTWRSMTRLWENSQLRRRKRHEWTLWAIIWLLCRCLEDLFLSCVTRKAEGMGTPAWCTVVTTHRTGKYLLKNQRAQCWRSSCAINMKRQVFNCESASTQTLHIPRVFHRPHNYGTDGCQLCSPLQSKCVNPRSRVVFKFPNIAERSQGIQRNRKMCSNSKNKRNPPKLALN